MKTQNELQKINDQQLTFELACLVFGADDCFMSLFGKVAETTTEATRYVDLNDWSWIMPLAVEHDVYYAPSEKGYTCKRYSRRGLADIEVQEDTMQRAIAICLVLKLQEVAE